MIFFSSQPNLHSKKLSRRGEEGQKQTGGAGGGRKMEGMEGGSINEKNLEEKEGRNFIYKSFKNRKILKILDLNLSNYLQV